MAIELYSTLTRQKAAFKPLTENEVKMYVCGVTVYDYTHIGHGRTFISFDIIRRWLEARGFKVTFVRNITDVDDKIIRRAAERKVTCDELTAEFGKAMQDDMIALGCLPPTHEPRATHFIPQMLNIIDRLQANGLAYQTESGDVAYNVRGFNGYGKLSGKDIDDLRSGERVAADQLHFAYKDLETELGDYSIADVMDSLIRKASPRLKGLYNDGQVAFFVSPSIYQLYEGYLDNNYSTATYADSQYGRKQLMFRGFPLVEINLEPSIEGSKLSQDFIIFTDRRNLVLAVNTADSPGSEVRMWYNPDEMENRQRAVFAIGCEILDEELVTAYINAE